MKEYFSHDYNARNDTKLVKLFMKLGLEGIGAYWCIIEMLYEEGGYLLRNEYERIAFELRTDYNVIKKIVEELDLFVFDDEKFWSETALSRLNQRMEKSQKARESVEKRWKKYERNTNVKQSKNDSNTSKVKESKVNEIKENNSSIMYNSATAIMKLLNSIPKEKIDEMKELTLFNGNLKELKEKFAVEFIGRYGLNKTAPEVIETFQSWMHRDKTFKKEETPKRLKLSEFKKP